MNIRTLFSRLQHKDLSRLEARLDSAFRPVGPRPEFVKRLRFELLPPARRHLLGIAAGGWQVVMLTAAGLVSVALLLHNGLRMAAAVLGALGLLRHARKSNAAQSAVPMKTVRQ
ncbi:MAG: hypothetical protein HYZ26_10780 [Chloroflexi bacterium]|nr:hypothetical protein [Chloroflexota bacterium]